MKYFYLACVAISLIAIVFMFVSWIEMRRQRDVAKDTLEAVSRMNSRLDEGNSRLTSQRDQLIHDKTRLSGELVRVKAYNKALEDEIRELRRSVEGLRWENGVLKGELSADETHSFEWHGVTVTVTGDATESAKRNLADLTRVLGV